MCKFVLCKNYCFTFNQLISYTGIMGCKHALLAHVKLFIHQNPQVLLCRAALNELFSLSVLMSRINNNLYSTYLLLPLTLPLFPYSYSLLLYLLLPLCCKNMYFTGSSLGLCSRFLSCISSETEEVSPLKEFCFWTNLRN